jgi:hypothetical protein
MSSRRIAPLLLAASVFLSGATGILVGAPAHAITSVDELSDVNRNHWAFEALRDLVEKYDVIEGYPDKTFRGNRTATRWEMAAALNALTKKIGEELARLGAEKADKKDLATLARLQEEFRNELAALTARVSALEGRATAIEAKNEEQDNRLSLLEKTQIHGDMSFGGLADIAANGRGSGDDGISDGISAVGRLRLTLAVPVREDRDDSKVGEGTVYTRLVAAFGRTAPAGAESGNTGAFNPFTGYSQIAGDASSFNEGFSPSSLNQGAVVGGNALRSNLYVESAFYKQHFKSGIPLLTNWLPGTDIMSDSDDWKTTGDLYAGVIPWRFLFDTSPFRGNELTQFQNTAFVNLPGIAVNTIAPTVAYQWHQGLGQSAGLDLTAAVSSVDVGDLMDGLSTTYEARLNYQTSFLGENFTKPGSLYAGGYHVWNAGNRTLGGQIQNTANLASTTLTNRVGATTNVIGQSSLNALYGGWNQEWYKGIGTYVGYTLAGNDNNNLSLNSTNFYSGANSARVNEGIVVSVRQALTGALNVPMSAIVPGWRDKDAMGIAYGFVDLQENGAGGSDAFEQLFEFYYRLQLTDSISVVPSFQMIFNRLGIEDNDAASIIGLRTNYTF